MDAVFCKKEKNPTDEPIIKEKALSLYQKT